MTNIDEEYLKREMLKYEEEMKKILPLEEKIRKLRRNGISTGEIKNILGSDCYIFDYVPNTLYHGSPESLDIINSKSLK